MKKALISILLLSSICFSNEFKKADFQYQYDFGNKNCSKLNDIQKEVIIENLKFGIFWAPNAPIISKNGEIINVLYGKNKFKCFKKYCELISLISFFYNFLI